MIFCVLGHANRQGALTLFMDGICMFRRKEEVKEEEEETWREPEKTAHEGGVKKRLYHFYYTVNTEVVTFSKETVFLSI